jgi:hypothetical protein
LRKCLQGGEVVASAQLVDGMVEFRDVPAYTIYWLYGAGMAGMIREWAKREG